MVLDLMQTNKQMLVIILFCLGIIGCGGSGGKNTASEKLENNKKNTAPVAIDDMVNIWVNETATFSVTSNDSDANGDNLIITELSMPANGVAKITNAEINYVPKTNFIGYDQFSYTISDSKGGTAKANVSITVNNKAPEAKNDNVSTKQSQTILLDILKNDSSQGQHQLTIVSTTEPNHGQLSNEQSGIYYIPQNGYVGQDAFGYVVRDSLGDESTATVSITVNNQPPIAESDIAQTIQNQSVLISVLDNDIDALGDNLTISGTSVPHKGDVSIDNNIIRYSPKLGFSGQDSFTYTLVDNYGATSSANVIIDVGNQFPLVVDDNIRVFAGNKIEVDVLSNDIDVEGDQLKITSVSTPKLGHLDVIDNKIVYTAPQSYEGEVIVGYTVSDNYNATDSGFITFDVSNSVIIKGEVANILIENLEVVLTIGDKTFKTFTDESGAFIAKISRDDLSHIIVASVKYPEQPYYLYSHLGTLGQIITNVNENGEVNIQPISHFTTAEYELLNHINLEPVITEASLTKNRQALDYDYVINLASAANMIITDNQIILPNHFNSVNDFMQAPYEVSKSLGKWRVNNNNDYTNAFESLFNSKEIIGSSTEFAQGEYFLYRHGKTSSVYNADLLMLNSSNEGYLVTNKHHTDPQTFKWTFSDSKLNLDLQSFNKEYLYQYNENAVAESFNFGVKNIELKTIFKTNNFTILFEKRIGCTQLTTDELGNDKCHSESQSHTIYQSRKLISTSTPIIGSGVYHFETVDYQQGENNTQIYTPLDTIAATFNLHENGTFIETTDSYNQSRSGNWLINGNNLEINYDNGLKVIYNEVNTFNGVPIYQYRAEENDQTSLVGTTYIIAQQAVSSFNHLGEFQYKALPLYDSDIDTNLKVPFYSDNTGIQENYQTGSWLDSYVSKYTWAFNNFIYVLDYYVRPNNYEYVTYCDVNKDDCEQWRYREFEVIGQQGDSYIIKNNQAYLDNSIIKSKFRSGYIGLFKYKPL